MQRLVRLGLALALAAGSSTFAHAQSLGVQGRYGTSLRAAQSLTTYDPAAASAAKTQPDVYTVSAKLVEYSRQGKEVILGEPQLAATEGVKASLSLHGYKSVQLGGGVAITAPAVTVSVPGSDRDEQLQLGRYLHVRVNGLPDSQVRVDVQVEGRELEAVEKGIRVSDRTVRAIETVTLGSPLHVIIEKNDDGTARSWLELRVRHSHDDLAYRPNRPLPRPLDTPATNPSRYEYGNRSTTGGLR